MIGLTAIVVGDWIYVSLCHYKYHLVAGRISLPGFVVSLRSLKKSNYVAHQLKLASTAKVHPTFLVFLKKKHGATSVLYTLPFDQEDACS